MDLKEEVYMHLSQVISSTFKSIVAKLSRSLYAIKQAPRAWFDKFQDALIHLDFHPGPYDPSMFIRYAFTEITVLLIYVDGILITNTNATMIQHLQAFSTSLSTWKILGL